jgi:hypothetical protein
MQSFTDSHGRSIGFTPDVDGRDLYQAPWGELRFAAGTPRAQVLATLDAMPPEAPPPATLEISAEEFFRLFHAAERLAMYADPRLLDGSIKVASQGHCNLASPECAQLLGLAVQLDALTGARRDAVLANQPPD